MLVEANIMMAAALEGTKKQVHLFQQFSATMAELSVCPPIPENAFISVC